MSSSPLTRPLGAPGWLVALLLVVAVLAPYHQLVAGRVIPIPDDGFASDLADGEFPPRVEAGRIVRSGEWPAWTPRIMTGAPLVVDPLSVVLFAALPPALALGWLVGLLLAVASAGTYALARWLGASRSGAFLAGFAFAWSGFFVCQLRHLSILGTVACFPWALLCLERAAAAAAGSGVADDTGGRTGRSALRWLTAFGAVFGLQALFGFPQTLYFAALVYGCLVVSRSAWLFVRTDSARSLTRRLTGPGVFAGGALAAVLTGALVGMAVVLPIRELGAISDRQGGVTWEWASRINYFPPNWATFFVPYVNGDVSNMSYRGSGIFWEDYGYVGLATVLAALVAVGVQMWKSISGRKGPATTTADQPGFAVWYWAGATLLAYGLVLGRATPLYQLAFNYLPGMSSFRFPTRFLFVVELGLALLASLGMTFIQRYIAERLPASRRRVVPAAVGVVIVAVTMLELVGHNFHQNPFVDAASWLASPQTARIIREQPDASGRIYSPAIRLLHNDASARAKGWSDLQPYWAHRDLLQPNSNLLHGLPAADAYFGISPSWMVNVLGDHNRMGVIQATYTLGPDGFRTVPAFFDWLEALSVRWVLLPVLFDSDRLEYVGRSPAATVYRLKGTQPRARVGTRMRLVRSADEVWRLTRAGQLDLRGEVLLHDAADVAGVERKMAGQDRSPGNARIVVDRANEVVVDAESPGGGVLVLADAYYPGWEASVDGERVPILQVNVIQRGVALGPGRHRVAFSYRSAALRLGLQLSGLGLAMLLSAAVLLRTRSGGAR